MRTITLIFTLLVTAIPSLAWAQLWVNGPEQCGEAVLDGVQELTDVQPSVQEPDCSEVSDTDDPSFNFCFADADNPISTFPEMLAQIQAEKLTLRVLARAQEAQEEILALTEPPAQEQETVVRRPRSLNLECSTFDVTCERAPRVPGALTLQSATTPPLFAPTNLDVPALDLAEIRGGNTSNPGLAPADGVKNVLVPPPDLA